MANEKRIEEWKIKKHTTDSAGQEITRWHSQTFNTANGALRTMQRLRKVLPKGSGDWYSIHDISA